MDLFLFTSTFPYKAGNTEVYLENELPVLANKFEHVYIFPEFTTGELRVLPLNVSVVQIDSDDYSFLKAVRGNWWSYLRMVGDFPFTRLTRSYIINRLSVLAHCFDRANKLHHWISRRSKEGAFVCYSYWCYNWATTLSLLKKRSGISHFVSRAHSNDLYEYMGAYKWIPHRRFQLEWVDRLYIISEYGLQYIRKKYPGFSGKYSRSYLGTASRIEPKPAGFSGAFKIVSCSNLSPIKRVHMIPEIIGYMKYPCEWTHIGKGKEENKVREAIQNSGVSDRCHLMGYLDNSAIKALYETGEIDVFLNISTTEGVPVSIMEAIAAAIPVVATDVGGTAEVVPPGGGWLVEKDFSPEEIAALLDKIYEMKQSGALGGWKKNARRFWENNFDADQNYRQFADDIQQFVNY